MKVQGTALLLVATVAAGAELVADWPEIGDCDQIIAAAQSRTLYVHKYVSPHSGITLVTIEDRTHQPSDADYEPYLVFAQTPQNCFRAAGNIAVCDQLLGPILDQLIVDDSPYALKLAWTIWELYAPEPHGGPIALETYLSMMTDPEKYPAPNIVATDFGWGLRFLALRQDGGINRWTVLMNNQKTISGIQVEEFEPANSGRTLFGAGRT